ncbi:amino acid adenylation domain-containing protein [Fulvivirga ulvae]|uniref:non-ribosomal peptide synthetase n=1 Tax=Fulvivirga ulvae TaxID=2904245 RepID=UPI001F357395|nr:non-ribosomal peptide synthetase [Fulvivirga ulvae]UII33613.1 amino acid adenylation domain-containing protein [Fulvivirga ulvae]
MSKDNKIHMVDRGYFTGHLDRWEGTDYFGDYEERHQEGYESGVVEVEVSEGLISGLNKVSASLRAQHMVLLSGFQVLASRLCGSSQALVFTGAYTDTGTSVSSGYVIPVMSELGATTTFRDILLQVKSCILDSLSHPHCNVTLLLRDRITGVSSGSLLGLTSAGIHQPSDLSGLLCDLHYHFEGSQVQISYNKLKYREDSILKLYGFYERLLLNLLAFPDQHYSKVELTSELEREHLLSQFDHRSVSYPESSTIVSLFASQVSLYPEQTAIVYGEVHMSYSSLDQASNRVAHMLMAHGGRPGDLIGLLTGRSHETIIGILGILKMGGVYVPVDVNYPAKRIQYILEDSGVDLVLSTEPVDGLAYKHQIIPISRSTDYSDLPVGVCPKPEDLCYIIYTSGTTGNPKGVMIPHRNVVRLLYNDSLDFEFRSSDIWVMFHSPCFDMSVWEIFGALLYGGELIVLSRETSMDTLAFIELLKESGVTCLCQTPSAFYNLIRHKDHHPEADFKLRYITLGGEAFNPSLMRSWYESYPETKVINMYGITETTVHNTFKHITREDIERGSSNIGRPLPTLSIYILDEHNCLVPNGMIGELHVGGIGLADGYYGKAELTCSRFIEHPYIEGERIYKSGDLVRVMENGELEYLSRKDNQVQLRGYRIELGSLENHLQNYEDIRQAVVLVQEQQEHKMLAAFYVSATPYKESTLRAYLSSQVPDYMIPSVFIHVPVLPLTPNGKTDKRALLALCSAPNRTSKASNPENEEELYLQNLWSQVLSQPADSLGTHTSFFSVGGNSLTVVMLKHSILKDYHVNVSISALFERDTISSQATLLKESDRTTHSQIQRTAPCLSYPLSPAQRRLYFVQHLEEDNTAYNMPFAVRLPVILEEDRLRKACEDLVERHEILRTTFDLEQGDPVQKVHEEGAVSVRFYQPDEGTDEAHLLQEFRESFSLNSLPLFRIGVVPGDTSSLLLFDIHHIISDGVTQRLLVKELLSLYQGVTLDPVPLQYRDYVIWYHSSERQAELVKQRQFWEREYVSLPSPLELPGDFPRPHFRSFAGDTLSLELADTTTQGLRNYAEEHSSSVYTVIYAAYYLLVGKLSGSDDLVIGTVTNGRNHPDLSDLFGMLASTLPIRMLLDRNLSFEAFHAQVKERVLQCMDHQDFPYEDLLESLDVARDTSRNPLFDICLVYEHLESDPEAREEYKAVPVQLDHKLSKFDLTLIVKETPEGLLLEMEYSTALFKPATIQVFMEAYQYILNSVLSDPGQSLRSVSLQAEGPEVYLNYPLTEPCFAPDQTVIDAFEMQVLAHADKLAVSYGEDRLSYSALNARSNRLARHLQMSGAGPGQCIGLYYNRSVEMIVAILAVLKTGSTYVPIDDEASSERIMEILSDSQALVLLTHSEKALTGLNIEVISSDTIDLASYSSENPGVSIPSETLAYIIYTSGTTGKSKGVMISHENLKNLVLNRDTPFAFSSSDTWTMFHRYCFDFSVWEIFSPLTTGGRLLVVSREELLDPALFLSRIVSDQVTVLNQTPTAFYNLMRVALQAPSAIKLRYIIFGGEKLQPGMLSDWNDTYPGVKLVNMYGITETTVHVTYKEITRPIISRNESNVGIPLAGYFACVVNSDGNIVPHGLPGELYVGGYGVSQGYIGNADLTGEKFISRPEVSPWKLYRSGDLVRVDAHGELIYYRRMDHQVQLKGFRVELQAIENILSTYKFIEEVKVVFRERSQDQYLVAYYIGPEEIDVVQFRRLLANKLPLYMIPSYFVRIDHLKVTANGKLDEQYLPDPIQHLTYGSKPAKTYIEKKISSIWSATLGLETVGLEDNYFSIGGDSITAIRLISRMNDTLHTRLKVSDLYKYQTLEELLAYARSEDSRGHERYYQEVQTELAEFSASYRSKHADPSIESVYPMSNIERGMSFIQLRNEEALIYFEQLVWEVTYEDFDIHVLEQALTLLTEKQSALRTALDVGENAHVIYKPFSIEVPYADLRGKPKQEQEGHIRSYMEHSQEHPFALDKAPLWRLSAFRLQEDFHVLIFEIHHAISDGWSIATFMTELNRTYRALQEDNAYRPAPLSTGYREFIIEEMVYDRMEESLDFWKSELSGFTKFSLNTPVEDSSFRSIKVPFDQDLFGSLEDLASSRGTTVKNLFFAAYMSSLNMMSYSSDIVAGLVTFNRMIGEEGVDVFGNFLNTIPVRLDLTEELTGELLLTKVEQKLQEIKAYDRTSLFRIARAMGVTNFTENPITDLLFNFTSFHVIYELSMDHSRSVTEEERVAIDNFIRGHGLFEVSVNGVRSNCFIQYDYVTTFISDTDFRRFTQIYENTLRLLADSLDRKINLSTVLAEDNGSLAELQGADRDIPKDFSILPLFASHVSSTPDGVALIYEGEEISYRDLDARSDQIASSLQSSGVVGGDVVGVLQERSPDLIASILGIFKAGGVYLPVDPDYPASRIREILEDSGAVCLLSGAFQSEAMGLPSSCFVIRTATLAKDTSAVLWTPADRSSTAYIIYTSGSTGQPKGVENTHGGLINRLLWMQEELGLTAGTRFLHKTPVVFDVSVWELILPLITGGTLVIARPEGHKDQSYLSTTIAEAGVEVIHFVPSMLSVFLDTMQLEGAMLPGVREVICSGEALKGVTVESFSSVFTHARLHNYYGPTEAAIDVTSICLDGYSGGVVSIGRPVLNTQIHIMDDQSRLLSRGSVGELCIGGVQVAAGYVNRPELTSSKFIIGEGELGRLYRTGDLARWRSDGTLEYLGRIDTQVKLRGYRIELGEISNVLERCAGVRQAAVALRHRGEDAHLVGYYVSDVLVNKEELKTHLSAYLPDYMVPEYYVELEALPLTHNGKLDYSSLPDYQVEVEEYQAPSNEVERRLVSIWSEILELPQDSISTNADFFELGGHSLTLMKLIQQINMRLGIIISMDIIFRNTTIETIASHINNRYSWAAGLDEKFKKIKQAETVKIAEIANSNSTNKLFFCAPMGGIMPSTSIVGILDMGPYLTDITDFFGVQAPALFPEMLEMINNDQDVNLRTWDFEFSRFKDIVEETTRAILKYQQDGTFLIGGFCSGCVLALEVSKKLRSIGKKVGPLVLVDPPLWMTAPVLPEKIAPAYTLGETASFIAKDIDWQAGIAPTDIEDLMKNQPLENVWEIGRRVLREKGAIKDETRAADIKRAFGHKFYNDQALSLFFAHNQYKVPVIAPEIPVLLLLPEASYSNDSDTVAYVESHIAENCRLGKFEGQNHTLFQEKYLREWIERVKQHLLHQEELIPG